MGHFLARNPLRVVVCVRNGIKRYGFMTKRIDVQDFDKRKDIFYLDTANAAVLYSYLTEKLLLSKLQCVFFFLPDFVFLPF